MDNKLSIAMVVIVEAAIGFSGQIARAGENRKYEQVEQIEKLLPIKAHGVVKPHELIAVKAKSSGRVENICVEEGEMVRAGAVLMQLESVDEQRTYERLKAELDRAKAYYEQSLIRLKDTKENRPLDIEVQEKVVDDARGACDEKRIDVDRLKELMPDLKSPLEDRRAGLALNRAEAVLAREEAALRRACSTLPILIAQAEKDAVANEAWVRTVEGQLNEAKARLDDTVILSPIDGMVCRVGVHRGELIQSGMSGLDGGTSLLQVADVSRMSVVAQVQTCDISAVRHITPDYAQPGRARVVSDSEMFGPEQVDKNTPASAMLRRVKVVADAYPEEVIDGVIERLMPEPRMGLEGCSSLNVRIRLRGTDLARMLGMAARVDFPADRRLSVLRVKNDVLHHEGSEVFVTVPYLEPASKVEKEKKVKVQVGPSDGTYTEIVSGLSAGDMVLASAPIIPTPSPQIIAAPPPAKVVAPEKTPVINAVDVGK